MEISEVILRLFIILVGVAMISLIAYLYGRAARRPSPRGRLPRFIREMESDREDSWNGTFIRVCGDIYALAIPEGSDFKIYTFMIREDGTIPQSNIDSWIIKGGLNG